MKLLVDEGVDSYIVTRLRQQGHNLWYMAEQDAGADDETMLALANRTVWTRIPPDLTCASDCSSPASSI
jgi:hypothetical protein